MELTPRIGFEKLRIGALLFNVFKRKFTIALSYRDKTFYMGSVEKFIHIR